MKTSQRGIDLIKKYEGFRASAYKCPAGVWTIGYGHTLGVKQGQTVSKDQAEEMLRDDLARYEGYVNGYASTYRLTQSQFDALVSFTYNCGKGNLDKLTANGKKEKGAVAADMQLYVYGGGKKLPGLVKRRKEEYDMFTEQLNAVEDRSGYFQAVTCTSERLDDVLRCAGAYPYYDTSASKMYLQRRPIAQVNGFPGSTYIGSAVQNECLLKLARGGKLRVPTGV